MTYPDYTTWCEPFLASLKASVKHPKRTGKYEVYKHGGKWAVSVPGMEWAKPYEFDTWIAAHLFVVDHARRLDRERV